MEQVQSLTEELNEYRASFSKKAPEEMKKAFQKGVDEIIEHGILEKAMGTGDKAKPFTLKNATGKEVSLDEYMEEGPVVLTWYRGGWCPYCNLTLQALQNILPHIKETGANLLALTPELPDKSLNTKEKHSLGFEVLTDLHNKIAEKYGLVFKVPDYVNTFYKQNFDISEYNGDESQTLPLAATYIINTDGIIKYAFVDADYRRRAEPETILKELNKLS